MNALLVIVLVGLMAMVVVSLVRGIIAFMNSTKLDLESSESTGPSEMQLKQNKMMMARILFQAGAVVVVAVLLFASR